MNAEHPVREIVDQAVAAIQASIPEPPEAGLILGSGLGPVAGSLQDAVRIACRDVPGYPGSTVAGHEGAFVFGTLSGVPVLCALGRIHGYEGFGEALAGLPARVLIQAGARVLVLTNSAGAINRDFAPGDLMLITDHINLTGKSPLSGPNIDDWGPRFPDVSRVWRPALRGALRQAADSLGETLRQGIYACMPGPQYETPAEIRMLRILGADAVGMSTVPEAIIAAHSSVPALGISVIGNMAAGIAKTALSHEDVLDQSAAAARRLSRLLQEAMPQIAG